MSEYATINELLQQEITRATSWLTENHQDIMQNFDPTVVKLQKKKKIILSPGALDDLNKC
jgi:K+/H+ antiporter YhaU regulatory subunit KhtT